MIDLHCHLLPEIDDGPTSVDAALTLARGLVADGIRHVVVTPHVFPGRFENRRSNIAEEFEAFAELLRDTDIELGLTWAGEVRLTPEVLPLLTRGELPFLGEHAGWRHMLLEMPDGQVPLGADRFAAKLVNEGIRPVVAHPERNRAVMDNVDKLQPMLDAGCLVQVTAGSLVGQFGERAQTTAHELMDRGWVHVIASDAHNMAGRRPRMSDGCAWIAQHYGEETARELTLMGPARLCGLTVHADGRIAPRTFPVRKPLPVLQRVG
jgi:protein-tyrosine phosphatase